MLRKQSVLSSTMPKSKWRRVQKRARKKICTHGACHGNCRLIKFTCQTQVEYIAKAIRIGCHIANRFTAPFYKGYRKMVPECVFSIGFLFWAAPQVRRSRMQRQEASSMPVLE